MPAFTTWNNRLPDPTFDVNNAGAQVTLGTGVKGVGFASATVRSRKDTQVSRTNSGRGVLREQGAHVWEIDINYNPMTRDEFDIVSTFLDTRNGRMNPFYVVLPQYSKSKNAMFNVLATNNVVQSANAAPAGRSYIIMDIANAAVTLSGLPQPGDFFNFEDATDLNHKKIYRVTRVETQADYYSPLTPYHGANQMRVHFFPPLVRAVPDNTVVRFISPMFRVIQKNDVWEYNLGTDNLYQFNLQLEEILP